jgi:cyclase
MQEIAPHVFIETSYPGVTLGAISKPHGLIQIDSPFRPDDIRAWRAVLYSMSGGVDRLLVNLDAHYDRTLGSRQLECMIVGHDRMAQIFRDRPLTFKAQTVETGADWELFQGLGSIRWAPPEFTFSDRLFIHWDNKPMILEHHAGPSTGAIWVVLPQEKIVFVGDAVVPHAPPFLASADLTAWKDTLALLSKPEYKNFMIVSGRGGLVTMDQVKEQVKFLDKVEHQLEKMNSDDVEKSVTQLLKSFDVPAEKQANYALRLRWGLQHYITHHHNPTAEPIDE